MTLANFAALGTSSSFALAGSLIYLAVQTHLNTRNTRALIHQGAAARTTAIKLGMMEADRSAAWVEGASGRGATPEDVRKLQFNLACATAIDALEEHYLQRKAGLVSGEQFARNAAFFGGLLREPGMRAFWQEERARTARVAPRFCAFVDSLCEAEVTDFASRV